MPRNAHRPLRSSRHSPSGGLVNVHSEPERWATLDIYAPHVDGTAELSLDFLEEKNPKGGTETILLVEDKEAVRKMTKNVIEDYGYHIIEVCTGVVAIETIGKLGGQKIDLLVTGVIMPKMRGKELSDRLRLVNPDLKVLFVSGYLESSSEREGLIDGRASFLQKPFSVRLIARKVRMVLDEE